jgi:hypothetical protein
MQYLHLKHHLKLQDAILNDVSNEDIASIFEEHKKN